MSPAKKTALSVSDTEAKPVWIPKCAQKTGKALAESTMTELQYWVTLDPWKLYLDSCATYQTFFVKEFLDMVHKGKSTMSGSCNVGTTSTNIQGWYGEFKVWLNEMGIANLLLIPMLENDGYIVSTHTKKDWVVITPKGKTITFKRDSGLCQGMPYIDLLYNKDIICMIETAQKNFSGFTKKEIEKAQLSCTVQRIIGHPPDGRFE